MMRAALLLALPTLCSALGNEWQGSWSYNSPGTTTCELGRCYIEVGTTLTQTCATGMDNVGDTTTGTNGDWKCTQPQDKPAVTSVVMISSAAATVATVQTTVAGLTTTPSIANTCQPKKNGDCDLGQIYGINLWRQGTGRYKNGGAASPSAPGSAMEISLSRAPGTCKDTLASGQTCTMACAAGYTAVTGTSGVINCNVNNAAGANTNNPGTTGGVLSGVTGETGQIFAAPPAGPSLRCVRCEVHDFRGAADHTQPYDGLLNVDMEATSELYGWAPNAEKRGWNAATAWQKIECDQTFGIGNWDWTATDQSYFGIPNAAQNTWSTPSYLSAAGLVEWAAGKGNPYQGTCYDHRTKVCNGKHGPIRCNADTEDCIAVDANKWNEYDWSSPCSDTNLAKEGSVYVGQRSTWATQAGAAGVTNNGMFPYFCPGRGQTDTQKQIRREMMMRGAGQEDQALNADGVTTAYGDGDAAGDALGLWRNQPWEVCGPKRTTHATMKIIGVPLFGVFSAVIVLWVMIMLLMQAPFMPEASGLQMVTQLLIKIITTLYAICIWCFSLSMFFSHNQLQAAAFGLPLALLIVVSNADKKMTWAGFLATGFYITVYFFFVTADSRNAIQVNTDATLFGADMRAQTDCSNYFDGWWVKDANMFHNGLSQAGTAVTNTANANNGGGNDDYAPWNTRDTASDATLAPYNRYYGYCAQKWLTACDFFFAFFLIAAFTNLAALSYTMLEVPSETVEEAAEEAIADEEEANAPDGGE